jgi:hypothetical protein
VAKDRVMATKRIRAGMRYKGGSRIDDAIESDCCLLNYVKLRKQHYKRDKKMTKREATPEQYPDLAFAHDGLYEKGLAPDKKIEAVANYMITGSVTATASAIGVSPQVIKAAIDTDWFQFVYRELVLEKSVQLKAKFDRVIDKTIGKIEEGLDTGDEKLAKDGSKTNVRVSTRDSAYVLGAVMEQKRKVEQTEQTEDKQAEALKMLQSISTALEDASRVHKGKDITSKVEVIEVKDDK